MNRLCKIITMIALIMIVVSVSIAVNAYTNDDVIAYITGPHTVNGRTEQLSKKQASSLRQYFKSNPVSNAEADQIIAKLDEAKSIIANSGAESLGDLSEAQKAKVVSLVKEAGKIAGLEIIIDTEHEIVTVKDSNGNIIISGASYSKLFSSNSSNVKDKNSGTSSTGGSNSNSSSTTTNTNTNTKLVYTGSNYLAGIKTVLAIVAIAILGIIIRKRYAK